MSQQAFDTGDPRVTPLTREEFEKRIDQLEEELASRFEGVKHLEALNMLFTSPRHLARIFVHRVYMEMIGAEWRETHGYGKPDGDHTKKKITADNSPLITALRHKNNAEADYYLRSTWDHYYESGRRSIDQAQYAPNGYPSRSDMAALFGDLSTACAPVMEGIFSIYEHRLSWNITDPDLFMLQEWEETNDLQILLDFSGSERLVRHVGARAELIRTGDQTIDGSAPIEVSRSRSLPRYLGIFQPRRILQSDPLMRSIIEAEWWAAYDTNWQQYLSQVAEYERIRKDQKYQDEFEEDQGVTDPKPPKPVVPYKADSFSQKIRTALESVHLPVNDEKIPVFEYIQNQLALLKDIVWNNDLLSLENSASQKGFLSLQRHINNILEALNSANSVLANEFNRQDTGEEGDLLKRYEHFLIWSTNVQQLSAYYIRLMRHNMHIQNAQLPAKMPLLRAQVMNVISELDDHLRHMTRRTSLHMSLGNNDVAPGSKESMATAVRRGLATVPGLTQTTSRRPIEMTIVEPHRESESGVMRTSIYTAIESLLLAEIVRQIMHSRQDQEEVTAIDIGTGLGYLALIPAKLGCKVFAQDIVPDAVRAVLHQSVFAQTPGESSLTKQQARRILPVVADMLQNHLDNPDLIPNGADVVNGNLPAVKNLRLSALDSSRTADAPPEDTDSDIAFPTGVTIDMAYETHETSGREYHEKLFDQARFVLKPDGHLITIFSSMNNQDQLKKDAERFGYDVHNVATFDADLRDSLYWEAAGLTPGVSMKRFIDDLLASEVKAKRLTVEVATQRLDVLASAGYYTDAPLNRFWLAIDIMEAIETGSFDIARPTFAPRSAAAQASWEPRDVEFGRQEELHVVVLTLSQEWKTFLNTYRVEPGSRHLTEDWTAISAAWEKSRVASTYSPVVK